MDDQQARDEIDAELLRQLREDEPVRAWAQIETEYGQMMLATANAKLGFAAALQGAGAIGAWSAHDVVQQVIGELMRHGPALADKITGSLGGYLRGAVRKRALTAFEKQHGEVVLDDDVLVERGDQHDIAEIVVDEQVVEEALGPLSSRDRYVVEETVMHKRSKADVARELNLTGQGVGKIQARALADITKRIGAEHP